MLRNVTLNSHRWPKWSLFLEPCELLKGWMSLVTVSNPEWLGWFAIIGHMCMCFSFPLHCFWIPVFLEGLWHTTLTYARYVSFCFISWFLFQHITLWFLDWLPLMTFVFFLPQGLGLWFLVSLCWNWVPSALGIQQFFLHLPFISGAVSEIQDKDSGLGSHELSRDVVRCLLPWRLLWMATGQMTCHHSATAACVICLF